MSTSTDYQQANGPSTHVDDIAARFQAAAASEPARPSDRGINPLHQNHQRAPKRCVTRHDAIFGPHRLANAVFDAHRDDPEFGYRFLADEVRTGSHADVGDRTVCQIASENGWWCNFGKKKTRKKSAPAPAAHDDLVRRQFAAKGPNQVWVADSEVLRSCNAIRCGCV